MPIEQLLALYKGMQDDSAAEKLSDSESNASDPIHVQGKTLPFEATNDKDSPLRTTRIESLLAALSKSSSNP